MERVLTWKDKILQCGASFGLLEAMEVDETCSEAPKEDKTIADAAKGLFNIAIFIYPIHCLPILVWLVGNLVS